MCSHHSISLKSRLFFSNQMTLVYLFILVLATLVPGPVQSAVNASEKRKILEVTRDSTVIKASAVVKESEQKNVPNEINAPEITTVPEAMKLPEKVKEYGVIKGTESAKRQYILYSLLVAELAAQRHLQEISLSHFLELARITQDPNIAKEATEWAIEFQAPEEALLASEYWAKMAPDDLQAQMVATTLLIGQSINRALPYLTRAIELDPKEIGQHIVAIQSKLSTRSAEHLKMALLRIATLHPNNPYASLAAAQSAAQQEDITNANRWVDSALNLMPNLTQALELKAKLIRYEDNSDARALKFLKERVIKFAENPELRLFYATALVDANQNKEAVHHLKLLTDDKVYGGQALLYLGEIYRKEGDLSRSLQTWEEALNHTDIKDNARFLLGELSEQQGKIKEAVSWFTKIESGPFHITAQLRAAELLKSTKEYEQAIHILHDSSPTTTEEQKQLLLAEIDILVAKKQLIDAMAMADEVLAKIPTDEDMLLAHSLVAIKLKQLSIAEKDLKNILQQNPNNAEALNTLGYILSNQKDRMEEAKQYLEQSLSIAPNNPAYLDSMGWLYFKMNQPEKALDYLKKAHELSSDAEIAAHLGEVLWVMGKKDEAKVIWERARTQNPQNETLRETLTRYKQELKSLNTVHN